MDSEVKEQQKIDLSLLIGDITREAKRLLVWGLVLVFAGSVLVTAFSYNAYYPVYEASASFTVKVANPLYASVSSYNIKTAEQMAATFPYILTSGVLQERVKEHLGISSLPQVSVSASSGSSIITLRVRDADPQRAYDVLNAVIEYYPEIAEFVVGATVLVMLDESGVPTQPVSSFSFRGPALKGAAVCFTAWAVLVVLLALTRNTVHNEEELRYVISAPCLGQVPAVKVPSGQHCPLLHKNRSRGGFGESIRLLRLRVEKAMQEQGRKVLLISSAIPGEGKTTVSVNLAVSLAKKGNKVLLIDCDLRNPSVAKVLNVENEHALSEYLDGKLSEEDMLRPTEVKNLFVFAGLGAGNNSSRRFRERTGQLIQGARSVFDYIILDTPPCSLLADAAEIADLAECGLMVIRQDFASRDQMLDGIRSLSEGKLPIIGCALNNMRRNVSGDYGYGYGYGYGENTD